MELTVVTKLGPDGKELAVDESIHEHLAAKLGKIEARWGKAIIARAVLIELPDGYETTITLHGGQGFVGKAHADPLLKAIDASVDKLIRQFENDADKRTGRERQRRGSGTVKAADF